MDVLETVGSILFYSTLVYCLICVVGIYGYSEVFNPAFKKSKVYSFFRTTCTWAAGIFFLLILVGGILSLTGVIEDDSSGCYNNPYSGDSSCDYINE